MLPKWAFGYVQSKERYKTQEEILTTAEEFQKRDIPVSCLVLDWHSWEEGKWGNKIFDKSRFPDARDDGGRTSQKRNRIYDIGMAEYESRGQKITKRWQRQASF